MKEEEEENSTLACGVFDISLTTTYIPILDQAKWVQPLKKTC